jgi:hypothetical protein
MVTFMLAISACISASVNLHPRLALEAVALRQQLAVYKRKHPRPKLRRSDRLFWIVLRRRSKHWSEALISVRCAVSITRLDVSIATSIPTLSREPKVHFDDLQGFRAVSWDHDRMLESHHKQQARGAEWLRPEQQQRN